MFQANAEMRAHPEMARSCRSSFGILLPTMWQVCNCLAQINRLLLQVLLEKIDLY